MSSTTGVDPWVPELAVAPPKSLHDRRDDNACTPPPLPPRRPCAQYLCPEQPVGGSNSDAAICLTALVLSDHDLRCQIPERRAVPGAMIFTTDQVLSENDMRNMIPKHCCASWIHANPPHSVQATGQTASPDDAPRAVADIGRNGLRDSQNERKAYGLLAPAHTNNAFVQMGVEAANKMGLAYVVRAFEPGAWPGVLELPAPPTPSTSGAIKSAKPEVCVPRRTMASKQRVQPLRSKMPVSSPCCTPEKPKKARPTIESLIGMILAVCLVTAIVAALLWPSAEHDTGLARLSRRVLGTHAAQGKGPEKRNRSVKTLLFPLAGRNIESRQLLRAYEQELLRRGLGVST